MDLSSVSAKSVRNELPIHLLCSSEGKGEGAMDKPEYVESIWKLLRAYPETAFCSVLYTGSAATQENVR